jgi:pimeloyl-ACP methyl ester carboxylesterase
VAEVVVLLHGLGGTHGVWDRLAKLIHGPVHVPDLPGHGSAPWLDTYTFSTMAEQVAAGLPPASSYAVIGHSLGGVVALELARQQRAVRRVVGLGIKVEWTDDELARGRELAGRPIAWFETESEALARHRRISGVGDLVDDRVAHEGVLEAGGVWRLAMDSRAFGVGRPDMVGLLDNASAVVTLARGEHDHMVTDEQLAALVPDPVMLPGLGHNAHLEDPAAVRALL